MTKEEFNTLVVGDKVIDKVYITRNPNYIGTVVNIVTDRKNIKTITTAGDEKGDDGIYKSYYTSDYIPGVKDLEFYYNEELYKNYIKTVNPKTLKLIHKYSK